MVYPQVSLFVLLGAVFLNGCGSEKPDRDASDELAALPAKDSISLNTRWDQANMPSQMDAMLGDQGYKYNIDDLPVSGRLDREPWSGGYWPTYMGGMAYRWSMPDSTDEKMYGYHMLTPDDIQPEHDLSYLSPVEKFDLLLGHDDFKYTKEERARTRIMHTVRGSEDYDPGYKIPRWEGLCHAWAPATLAFEEPSPVQVRVRQRDGKILLIPFGSSDIKGLLTYFLHHSKATTNFLGKRCNIDLDKLFQKYRLGKISRRRFLREKKKCRDTNAGSFHIVLTNQIGLLKEGFIADIDRDAQVWNQPVFKYQLEYGRVRRPGLAAARGTVRELEVNTKMYYINEINYSWEKPLSPGAVYVKHYHYWLELDDADNILGGEWNSEVADRPDFLWKRQVPKFEGDYKILEKLYRFSLSHNQRRRGEAAPVLELAE